MYALDVYIGGTSSGTTMKQLRALDPVEPLLVLPEVTDRANWLDNRLDWADTEKQLNFVFVNLAKEVMAFDPRQAQVEDLDEVSELLDPRWKGKIVINDPTLSAGPGKTTMIWIWAVMGPEKATEFMRGLKSQAGAVSRDERQVIEWVARGRYPVLVAPNDSILQALAHEGLRVGLVPGIKDYGTFITASSGSLTYLNRAPHPNAAKVFVNWVLSREGQTAYSLGTKQPSRRVDVPTDHLSPTSVPQPGGKYWPSYYEENVSVPPALEVVLKEVFER
jgi:ABC-type Fe3+ transport system substrate-binding protein